MNGPWFMFYDNKWENTLMISLKRPRMTLHMMKSCWKVIACKQWTRRLKSSVNSQKVWNKLIAPFYFKAAISNTVHCLTNSLYFTKHNSPRVNAVRPIGVKSTSHQGYRLVCEHKSTKLLYVCLRHSLLRKTCPKTTIQSSGTIKDWHQKQSTGSRPRL